MNRSLQMMLATLAAALLVPAAFAQSASAPAAATAAPAPAAAPAAKPAAEAPASADQGKLAWYGRKFAGRKTASGERFNPAAMTMAHKTLPMGTRVKVTNLKNNRSVMLRVNDRGPSQPDRIGDVSQAAAAKLRMMRSGVIEAKIEVVAAAPARKGQKQA